MVNSIVSSPGSSHADAAARHHHAALLGLAGATAVGLVLRLWGLGRIGLWYDEAFGLLMARLPPGEMQAALGLDVHPPLWFWLLRLWGTSTVEWARLLGVLCGTLTIPALFFALRRQAGGAAALAAAGLLAIHPLAVYHSQELRMYAPQALVLALLLGAAPAAVKRPGRQAFSGWAACGLLAALVMLMQYLGGAVAGGLWIGLVLAVRRWSPASLIGATVGTALALALPVAFLVRSMGLTLVEARDDATPLAVRAVVHALEGCFGLVRTAPWEFLGIGGGSLAWSLFGVALVAGLAVAGLAGLALDPPRRTAALIWGGALFGGLALLMAYQVAGFLFFPRFYVLLAVPACALLGVAVSRGPRLWRAGASLLITITLLSHTLGMLRVNDRLRDVTGPLVRWITVRASAPPPILADRMFIALPLMAHLPGAAIALPGTEVQTEAQRTLLAAHAREVDPSSRPLWLVVSGWGDSPAGPRGVDGDAILARAGSLALAFGQRPSSTRLLHVELAGGGKWAAVVELR